MRSQSAVVLARGGGSSVVSQLLVDKLFAAERYMKRMEPRFLKQQEGGILLYSFV